MDVLNLLLDPVCKVLTYLGLGFGIASIRQGPQPLNPRPRVEEAFCKTPLEP